MSYCRFSSDDFASDVYVYEDCMGGWTTHVAGNRVVGDVPKLPDLTKESVEAYMVARRAQSEFLRTAEHVDIKLPHASGRFNDDTAGECADTLEMLRGLGYHVPQSAIDALREESA